MPGHTSHKHSTKWQLSWLLLLFKLLQIQNQNLPRRGMSPFGILNTGSLREQMHRRARQRLQPRQDFSGVPELITTLPPEHNALFPSAPAYEGGPTELECTYKNRICSHRFKLESPSKYSLMQCTYWDTRPMALQFVSASLWRPFSASAMFCFTSSTISKAFPLEGLVIWGNKNKSLGARSGE